MPSLPNHGNYLCSYYMTDYRPNLCIRLTPDIRMLIDSKLNAFSSDLTQLDKEYEDHRNLKIVH